MIASFLIVTLQTLKNRTISRIRRLKNPRYLLSALAGAAYFYFMFLRRASHRGRLPGIIIAGSNSGTELTLDITSLIMLVLLIGAWALPEQSGGLEFSEAEIQFLFAAPITRTQILLYKYMRGFTGIVITAIVMSVLGFRQAKGFGLVFMFAAFSAYNIMVALARARLKQLHIGALSRIAIVAVIYVALSWAVTMQFKDLDIGGALARTSGKNLGTVTAAVDARFHSPIIDTLLFVPRMFATAVFPSDLVHLFIACATLVVLATVFLLIAARLNFAFEESSIRYSVRRAESRDRQQQQLRGVTVTWRRAKPLFRLGDNARPELAFIWKNSISVMRMSARNIAAIVLPLALFGIVVSQLKVISVADRFAMSGFATLIFSGILLLLGPMMLKNDLRLDLPRFEVLKTYPLSGETIVAGEIAAPLTLLSAAQILLITISTILFRFATIPSRLQIFSTLEFAIIAIMFVIPICAVQLLIQNAAVVYFPAWATPSKEDMKGFVATGQRMLVLICYLVALSVILIPPAAIFVPTVLFAGRFLKGTPVFAALATLVPVSVLVIEIYLALKLLGSQFESIDLSEER